MTDIFDGRSRLRFDINRYANNCSITVFNPDTNIHSPADLFQLTGEPPVQFTGQVI